MADLFAADFNRNIGGRRKPTNVQIALRLSWHLTGHIWSEGITQCAGNSGATRSDHDSVHLLLVRIHIKVLDSKKPQTMERRNDKKGSKLPRRVRTRSLDAKTTERIPDRYVRSNVITSNVRQKLSHIMLVRLPWISFFYYSRGGCCTLPVDNSFRCASGG